VCRREGGCAGVRMAAGMRMACGMREGVCAGRQACVREDMWVWQADVHEGGCA